jgi:heme/copper-type cytochrome/quinol oxidase subunit 2
MIGPLRRILVLLLLALAPGCSPNGPREIVVVARGMTFTLPSDPDTPNPLIRLKPGEQVTITLRNEAPGLIHDFRIPSWDFKTDQVRGGESTSVALTVPGSQGRYEYMCGPHSNMMHGFVEVTAP